MEVVRKIEAKGTDFGKPRATITIQDSGALQNVISTNVVSTQYYKEKNATVLLIYRVPAVCTLLLELVVADFPSPRQIEQDG